MEATSRRTSPVVVAGAGIVLVATLLRMAGANNDLWIDEMWSVEIANRLRSISDVFTAVHIDNNHHLNTIYLFLTAPNGNWPGCRLLSIIGGIGSVIMAGIIGRRRGVPTAVLSMLVMALSGMMVNYDSEARGYGTLAFFSLLSFEVMTRFLETQNWRRAAWFSVACVFGFLSHLIFINFFMALGTWAVFDLYQRRRSVKAIAVPLLQAFALPALFFVAMYVIDVRKMVIGGGDKSGWFDAYVEALAWMIRSPRGFLTGLTCAAALAALGAALYFQWREKRSTVVFYLGAIIVFPLLMIAVRQADFVYARYYYTGMVLLLMLWAELLGRLYERQKILAATLLAAWLGLNAIDIASLLKDGRGHYSEALLYMAKESAGRPLVFGGDHDYRIGDVASFHCGQLFKNGTWRFLNRKARLTETPDWIICHDMGVDEFSELRKKQEAQLGPAYVFDRSYPGGNYSGMRWTIYRLAAPNKI